LSASKLNNIERLELIYHGKNRRKSDPSHPILSIVGVQKFLLTGPKENFQDTDFLFRLVLPFYECRALNVLFAFKQLVLSTKVF